MIEDSAVDKSKSEISTLNLFDPTKRSNVSSHSASDIKLLDINSLEKLKE